MRGNAHTLAHRDWTMHVVSPCPLPQAKSLDIAQECLQTYFLEARRSDGGVWSCAGRGERGGGAAYGYDRGSAKGSGRVCTAGEGTEAVGQ